MQGNGEMIWKEGIKKYIGEFKNNQRNGTGTFYYENGNVFEGEWKDGKRNGKGTLTKKEGPMKSGIWEDDKLTTDESTSTGRRKKKK